jgi:4-amino-4-deoxy-L-arabinose transferase-like glycosyltransferase
MCALMAWSLERMIAWHQSGRPSALIMSAILVGLAAGAKYPAAVMLIPMGWMLWDKQRGRGLALWLRLTGLAALVFVITTPFALLDPREFWRDFSFEAGHAAGGHFGSLGQRSFPYVVSTFSHNLAGSPCCSFRYRCGSSREIRRIGSLGIGLWLTFLCFAARSRWLTSMQSDT